MSPQMAEKQRRNAHAYTYDKPAGGKYTVERLHVIPNRHRIQGGGIVSGQTSRPHGVCLGLGQAQRCGHVGHIGKSQNERAPKRESALLYLLALLVAAT